jgi:hypothetical protein
MTNVFNLIDKVMVPQGLVDPFRVYVNGLSPAAAPPGRSCAASTGSLLPLPPSLRLPPPLLIQVHRYKFTPIFHFQGALDTDPHPNTARALGNRILAGRR